MESWDEGLTDGRTQSCQNFYQEAIIISSSTRTNSPLLLHPNQISSKETWAFLTPSPHFLPSKGTTKITEKRQRTPPYPRPSSRLSSSRPLHQLCIIQELQMECVNFQELIFSAYSSEPQNLVPQRSFSPNTH